MSLRGDYNLAASDFSVEQDWGAYGEAEHALYRRLFERQSGLVARYACPEWIAALAGLDAGSGIPRFEAVSRRLRAKTGWEGSYGNDGYTFRRVVRGVTEAHSLDRSLLASLDAEAPVDMPQLKERGPRNKLEELLKK